MADWRYFAAVTRYIFSILLFAISIDISAQWQQYSAQWEGRQGFMMYNAELTDTTYRADLPYLVSVGWIYKNCDEQGLPDALTHESLTSVSQRLEGLMDIQTTSTLAGSFLHDCHWYDYYYAKDTLALEAFLKRFFRTYESDYTPIISMVEDSDWSFYDDRIYPDAYLIEYGLNAHTLKNYAHLTTDGPIKERLHHWAYFDDPDARDQYRIIVLERGFKEEGSGRQVGAAPEPYYYHFSRRDKLEVKYLTELTTHLRTHAIDLGGTYDGWEIPD